MTLTEKILQNKTVLIYGLSLAVLLLLLRWLELRFIIFDHSMEIYTGAIAVIFTALGIWLALQLTKPKVETVYSASGNSQSVPPEWHIMWERRLGGGRKAEKFKLYRRD